MFSSKQTHKFNYFICYHLESGWHVTRLNQGLSLGRGKSLGTRLRAMQYSHVSMCVLEEGRVMQCFLISIWGWGHAVFSHKYTGTWGKGGSSIVLTLVYGGEERGDHVVFSHKYEVREGSIQCYHVSTLGVERGLVGLQVWMGSGVFW